MNMIRQAAFSPATLRIIEIAYHCDLTKAAGRVIPLGVLVDMRATGVYGLGLVARQRLSEDEVCHIGGLIRDRISTPFDYLLTIFDEVMGATDPSSVFELLPDQHSLSVAFTLKGGARPITLPPPAKRSIETRRIWVRDELKSFGNDAYWKMFGEGDPVQVEKESKEDLKEAA
jgi:hypothetical protein